VAYKTIALLFGGVLDVEGKQHAVDSVFYSDLYQFDMVRKRWYEVKLRAVKSRAPAAKKKVVSSGGGSSNSNKSGSGRRRRRRSGAAADACCSDTNINNSGVLSRHLI